MTSLKRNICTNPSIFNIIQKSLIITAIVLASFSYKEGYAQTRLTGRIYEFKTHTHLDGIKIENLKTHVIAVSDTGGRYSIRAAVGDKIAYSSMSYKTDTVLVVNLKYKEIYLEPREDMMLKEVKIVNQEFNLGAIANTQPTGVLGSKTIKYQTDANGNNRGGVAVGLPGFNSDEKKRQKEAQLDADQQTETEIDNVFSAQSLQKYIPIKGQEMSNFTILYRPSIKVYHDNFNLAIYVDSCYKEFLKIPLEKRQSKDFLDINHKPRL